MKPITRSLRPIRSLLVIAFLAAGILPGPVWGPRNALAAVPSISGISPSSVIATWTQQTTTITLTGSNLTSAMVHADKTYTPSSNTSTQVVFDLQQSDSDHAASYTIYVTTGGGTSNTVTFTVNDPAPTTSSLGTTSAAACSTPFNLIVRCSDSSFRQDSTVYFNGSPRTTTPS